MLCGKGVSLKVRSSDFDPRARFVCCADPMLWNLPSNLSALAKCIALRSLHFLILGSDSRNNPAGDGFARSCDENRSVGGSIPPLGTIKINHLANILHFWKLTCP